MRIEVWSDVVCPFCYVGKRELDAALAQFENADQVEVIYRSFELDPNAAAQGEPLMAHLAAKYSMTEEQVTSQNDELAARAAEVGLNFNWRAAQSTNTLDAHRLIKLAETEGLGAEATDRLMQAYFTDGELVSDRETLVRIGTEIGLDADRVAAMLDGIEFAEQVRADQQQAVGYGIQGVPFFLFEGQWAVSGAQPAELFTEALETVWAETTKPRLIGLGEEFAGAGGGSCGCGGCGCGAR